MKNLLLATSLLLSTSAAHAGDTFLLLEDTEDLPPPYKQWWYATPSDFGGRGEPYAEILIRGDGKHGDFFGVLVVDCAIPENSEWVAVGGWLNAGAVPKRAITKLRKEVC